MGGTKRDVREVQDDEIYDKSFIRCLYVCTVTHFMALESPTPSLDAISRPHFSANLRNPVVLCTLLHFSFVPSLVPGQFLL